MTTTVKTGLICAAGAVAAGAVACGVITAVRVYKKKKAINYKEKIEAYKEAEKTNTVTEEVKTEAEEAKAEVKNLVKHEMINNAKCLAVLAVVGFTMGCLADEMYRAGFAEGSVEAISYNAGLHDAELECGVMKAKDLKPGDFTEYAKGFISGWAEKDSSVLLKADWKDRVDAIANLAKENLKLTMEVAA